MAGKIIHGRLSGTTSAATRIYPLLLPQSPTLPAVTYQQISTTRQHAFGADGSVTAVRMQVDAWARTYAEARTLADQIAAQLSRFSGTVSGIVVQDVSLLTEQELHESDTGNRRVSQDYLLFIEG